MRIITAFAFALLVFIPPLGAAEIRLDGEFIQGGMVRGMAPPGTAVTLDGRALKVSPEGHFVFGFGRDASPAAELVLVHPGGEAETRTFNIMSRQYDIQRIEGLTIRRAQAQELLPRRSGNRPLSQRLAEQIGAPP